MHERSGIRCHTAPLKLQKLNTNVPQKVLHGYGCNATGGLTMINFGSISGLVSKSISNFPFFQAI